MVKGCVEFPVEFAKKVLLSKLCRAQKGGHPNLRAGLHPMITSIVLILCFRLKVVATSQLTGYLLENVIVHDTMDFGTQIISHKHKHSCYNECLQEEKECSSRMIHYCITITIFFCAQSLCLCIPLSDNPS